MYKTNMSTREIRRALKRSLIEHAKAGGKAMHVNLSNEPWKRDDQKWFLANPSRSYRIRRLFINELSAEIDSGYMHVIVRQLIPGFRDKAFLQNTTNGGAGFDALPDSDTIGMLLWEKVNNGSTVVCLNALVREAKLIDASGGCVQ